MHEMYTVKSHTAFIYYWLLKKDAPKHQAKLKKDLIEDKDLKSINEWVECVNALGRLAFGEKDFQEMITGDKNVKALSERNGNRKSKEIETK